MNRVAANEGILAVSIVVVELWHVIFQKVEVGGGTCLVKSAAMVG